MTKDIVTKSSDKGASECIDALTAVRFNDCSLSLTKHVYALSFKFWLLFHDLGDRLK